MKQSAGFFLSMAAVFSCSGMSFEARLHLEQAQREAREKRLPNKVKWEFEEAAKALKRLASRWQSELKTIITTQGLVHTCEQRTRCYNGCSTFTLERMDDNAKAYCDQMSMLVDGISEPELLEIETITNKLDKYNYDAITDAEIARIHKINEQYRAIQKVQNQLEAIAEIWTQQMVAMVTIKKDKEKKCIVQ